MEHKEEWWVEIISQQFTHLSSKDLMRLRYFAKEIATKAREEGKKEACEYFLVKSYFPLYPQSGKAVVSVDIINEYKDSLEK